MRKLITTLAMAGVLGLGTASAASAAAVPGYEGLYNAALVACTLPAGSAEACQAALQAYAAALVGVVDLAVATASFEELRNEVIAANGGDTAFLADIEALFELLLPESGALGPSASPTIPG